MELSFALLIHADQEGFWAPILVTVTEVYKRQRVLGDWCPGVSGAV